MRKIVFSFLVFLFITVFSFSKTRKTIYVVMDGIPADYIERLHPKTIFNIASEGAYARAFTGGEIGMYSQTPTISAIGYTNMLTGTWFNKHNVGGNSNLKPNYNYWTMFRIAKEQKKDFKTAIFSSWTDNRTVLIGENKAETNHLKIDYVYDGYELDKVSFPDKKDHLHIFDIDSVVCEKAANCLRTEAPDLSWVYLWYTDSGFHLYGDGSFMDSYVNKTDALLSRIWEAVQFREENFDEEWLVIITSDHGRTESGHGHGGQSQRERSVWFSVNQDNVNEHFKSSNLSLVDLLPTVCSFMNFEIPDDVRYEQEGIPFLGKVDVDNLKTKPYDDTVTLTWDCYSSDEKVTIYLATTNNFKRGDKDRWIKVGVVPASLETFTIDLSKYPTSKFYKFVVQGPHNHLSRWLLK